MEQITSRVLRNAEWKPVYFYPGAGAFSFTTYACDKLPGLTITKELRGRKTNTIYKFDGRKTNSPTQAVRLWNDKARKAKADGGRPPAGSPKSAGRSRRGAGI